MIVRIAGDRQYALQGEAAGAVERLDAILQEAVEKGEEDRFNATFRELLALVSERGEPLPEEELAVSDLILPPPDTTFAEARFDLSGEGWLPE